MYTVSLSKSAAAAFEVSRFFNTKRAALNWARWLATLSSVHLVKVHRGEGGAELVAELAGPA